MQDLLHRREPALSEVGGVPAARTAGTPHAFEAGGLRLAFVPEDESLFLLDDIGWDGLALLLGGSGERRVRRELALRHGPGPAEACLRELREAGLIPGATEAGVPSGPEDWLPSAAGRPLLRALCLNVAHDCDLACRYCFAGRGGFGRKRRLMSPDTAQAAVELLLAASGDIDSCEIDFFGGEPLLNLDVIRAVVDYARRRGPESGKRFGFTVTTNAAALGFKEASYLDETMENVVLSLDGRPEVHNRMRPTPDGGPSHGVVLENVKRFVEMRYDRDYWVRGTYTAFNLDFTEDVRYLADQGFTHISLEPAVGGPVGAGLWGLGPEHVERAAAEYLRLAEFLHERAAAGHPVQFFHFIAEPEAGPCYAKRVRGCGAGREYMAVTPEGDVYPCHQFVAWDEYRTGRLDELRAGVFAGPARLKSAGEVGVPGEKSTEVGRLWLGSKEICQGCWARYRCSGGCHANALGATGDIRRPDPLGCALLKARLEAALYLEALQRGRVPASPDGLSQVSQ